MKLVQAVQVDVSVKLGVRFHSKSRSLLLLPPIDPQSTRGKPAIDRSFRGFEVQRFWVDELPAELDDGLTAR